MQDEPEGLGPLADIIKEKLLMMQKAKSDLGEHPGIDEPVANDAVTPREIAMSSQGPLVNRERYDEDAQRDEDTHATGRSARPPIHTKMGLEDDLIETTAPGRPSVDEVRDDKFDEYAHKMLKFLHEMHPDIDLSPVKAKMDAHIAAMKGKK